MKRVLVTEKLAPAGLERLRDAGLEVDVRLDLTPDELIEVIPGAAAVIVRSATRIGRPVLEAGRDLVVVGRAGIGLDNVDVEAATELGVMVVNAPQSNAVSAAEHAIALMLSLARNIPQAHGSLREGRWERSRWTGVELSEKTVGVIGLGRIGRLVAERLAGFGVELLAYDPYVTAEGAGQLNVELVTLEELMRRSDFITIHLPRTPETAGLIDARALARARPGLRIVNAARGGIIDEAALYAALEEGRIAGAALDVFTEEPPSGSPLPQRDDVVVTPHLGAATVEAQTRAGVTIAEQVVLALGGQFVPLAVNIRAAQVSDELQPYLPLAEKLGLFAAERCPERPDAVVIGAVGNLADYDTRILELAVLKGMLGPFHEAPVTYVNAPQIAQELGVTARVERHSESASYRNLLEVEACGHRVAGTMIEPLSEPRVVAIDGHQVDVPVASHLVLIRNRDRPGMMGAVGMALGRAGVNISHMSLGRAPGDELALMVLVTDEPVAPKVIEALEAVDGISSVERVHLG